MTAKQDTKILLGLLVGFVAFSLPLLIHDTQHIWGSPSPPAEEDTQPPGPPPWHSYEDDDAGAKFRHAVADGDMLKAEQLYAEAKMEDPPVDLVTMEHWHGATPLFEAARSGHLNMAKWLVEKGANPDKANEWGDTAANEAASMGHWDIVWFLADKGANLVRTTEHAHTTLVLSAVRHRSTDALTELQKRGVDMTQRSWNGATPLHEAARTGEAGVVDWFLTHSRDTLLNATNDQGETAVHEAAMMGHSGVVWKLIEAGAALGAPGSGAATSLLFAGVQHGHLKLLELLDQRGLLDVEADSHGRIALVEAVRQGSDEVVDWLLKHRANVSARTSSGETPISIAAMEDRFGLVWKLHEAGGSLQETNEWGGTLLMSAVHYGHHEDVKKLLHLGLDVNAYNHRGDTPLTLAASRDDLPLVQTLLQQGAKPDAVGTRLDTPLHRASRFRRLETVRYLLEHKLGAVDAVNVREDTPLLEACRAGSLSVVELLLNNGASVQVTNRKGMTPLLEAAENGHLAVVEKLLEQPGIDVHARNKVGDGALELARWTRTSDEMSEVLKAKGVEPAYPEHEHETTHDHYNDDDYHGGRGMHD